MIGFQTIWENQLLKVIEITRQMEILKLQMTKSMLWFILYLFVRFHLMSISKRNIYNIYLKFNTTPSPQEQLTNWPIKVEFVLVLILPENVCFSLIVIKKRIRRIEHVEMNSGTFYIKNLYKNLKSMGRNLMESFGWETSIQEQME